MCADRYELRPTVGGRNANGYISYVRQVPSWKQGRKQSTVDQIKIRTQESCSKERVWLHARLSGAEQGTASNPGAPDNSRTFVPGPVTPHTAGLSPPPACADPFANHVDEQPPIGGPDATQPASADLEPPTSLLDRLNSDQRDSFLHSGTSCRRISEKPHSISTVRVGTQTS